MSLNYDSKQTKPGHLDPHSLLRNIRAKPNLAKKLLWSKKCFDCLDVERKGYLLKKDVLDPLLLIGVSTHPLLVSFVREIDKRETVESIDFDEFERLMIG